MLDSIHLLMLKIIFHIHLKLIHAGTGIVMNNLRDKFWVLQCRRMIRSVIRKCIIYHRYTSKMKASPGLLPENRVRNAAAFEMIGIDYAHFF